MSDVDELRTLLRDKADEISLDVQVPARLRERARRRRVGTTVIAALVVLGVAAGATQAMRFALELRDSRRTHLELAGSGTTVGSIWPASEAELEAARQAAADGRETFWFDPEATARMFGVRVLGWAESDIRTDLETQVPTQVTIRNDSLDPSLKTSLVLRPSSDPRIYGVVEVRTGAVSNISPWPYFAWHPGEAVDFMGFLIDPIPDLTIEASLHWDGGSATGRDYPETVEGGVGVPSGQEPMSGIFGQFYDVSVEQPENLDGPPIASLTLLGSDDEMLGLTAFRLGAGSAAPGYTLPRIEKTRDAVAVAAQQRDWEALRELIPERGFTFSYGGERDAIAYWKSLEADGEPVLETLVKILQLPFDPGDPYTFPAQAAEDPSQWTEEDLVELRQFASEKDIENWRELGTYLGWRAGFDFRGRWVFYVAGD